MSGTLAQGSRGEKVENLQGLLKNEGYRIGTVDGDFGPQTETALRDYQNDKGLKATGVLDEQTKQNMENNFGIGVLDHGHRPDTYGSPYRKGAEGSITHNGDRGTSVNLGGPSLKVLQNSDVQETVRIGSKGQEVMDLQNKLNNHGYDVAVDGNFGPGTKDAVTDFQQKNGLEADGIVGPATRELVNKSPYASRSNDLDATLMAANLSVEITGGQHVTDQYQAANASPGQEQSRENYVG